MNWGCRDGELESAFGEVMSAEGLEREIKLCVDEEYELPAVDRLTGGGVSVRELPTRELTAVYYDTADHRLARWGCSLRFRSDDGWTVKLASGVDQGVLARAEINFPGTDDAVPTDAVALVSGFTRGSPLAPAATVVTTRHPVELADGDGRELAELVDDHVVVNRPGEDEWRFRMLEVELAETTAPGDVDRLIGELVNAGATPTTRSKIEIALGKAHPTGDELPVPDVGSAPTAREVIVASITGATRQLVTNLPDVRLDTGPENVHQARVAVRRLRSDLGTFRPLLDDSWVPELRDELRWLGGVLGEVRDLDVLIPTLEDVAEAHPVMEPADLQAVVDHFHRSRAERRRRMLAALDSERATALVDRLIAVSRNPHTAPQADDPADELLPGLARKPWRRLRRAVDSLSASSTDQDLHRIRIHAKRARYAAEAVAPASGKPARRFAKAMTDIQDCLGELNDAIVIGGHLREAARADPTLAFPAGQLASLLGVRAEHTRKDFRRVWRRASRKQLRGWW